jgi:hypothetical protein
MNKHSSRKKRDKINSKVTKMQTEKRKKEQTERSKQIHKQKERRKHTFVVLVLFVRDDGDVSVGRGPLDLDEDDLGDGSFGHQNGNLLVVLQGCNVT